MARTRHICPKCNKNPLFWETSRRWGPRLFCICGYSKELGGVSKREADDIQVKALIKSIDRNIDKLKDK